MPSWIDISWVEVAQTAIAAAALAAAAWFARRIINLPEDYVPRQELNDELAALKGRIDSDFEAQAKRSDERADALNSRFDQTDRYLIEAMRRIDHLTEAVGGKADRPLPKDRS